MHSYVKTNIPTNNQNLNMFLWVGPIHNSISNKIYPFLANYQNKIAVNGHHHF